MVPLVIGAVSFYGNIAAAAESGLDFSTRWLEAVGEDFLTMRTDTIVPVDLNAFLYAHERVLGDLYQKQGTVWKFYVPVFCMYDDKVSRTENAGN